MTGSGPLQISLFGPMQVLAGGQPLPRLRSRKALWLLALLTLRHGRPVEREWLAGTLWPDVSQSQAFANLRPTLSELRSALATQGERLQSPSRHTLCLNLDGAAVDVVTFDLGVESGQLPAMEHAVSLYRGPLLEGCAEEWVSQERIWREESCLRALQKLGDAALADGDHDAASGFYRRAVSIDPLREVAQRGLMAALSRGGDTNAALQVYRTYVGLLKDDPRASPDEETSALYTRLRSEARQRASRPAGVVAQEPSIAVVAGHLPHPLTELVGREDERTDVAARLRRSRLVTLTGLGGIGKTRLAIEVVADVAGEYADGVWLVSLESLSDGRLLAQQIASALGLREEAGRPLLQSVTEHLQRKRLLLVLDNCEHLLEACAQVAGHLLRECARLRILATSREALGITGETAWNVPRLSVPDPAHLPPGRATLLRVLVGYEGIRLFVERAQAVQKGFDLTGSNVLAVARICWQLDGIPLAIELAAARVRAMTVDQIAARLEDHSVLMMGGSRTAQPRQQTLHATLDWSHALLSEPERLLLRRLSVFAGGWSLTACEEVCVGDGIHAGHVVDLLTSLVDKSLVAFEQRDPEAGGRYRLLEIVRRYAAERLQASGETDRVKARHRDWLVALAEEAEPQLIGEQQGVWLRRLETEHDNLRATLAWEGAEAQGAKTDLLLVGILYRFWYGRGHISEGREHLGPVLDQLAAQARTMSRAKALNAAGALAYSQADYTAARALNEEALSIRRELGDRGGIAWSLHSLGNVAYDQGDYASAWALHEENLSIRRELGDREGIAWSLNSLANLAHPRGDFAAARAMYEESLSLFREMGDSRGVARTQSCLGYLALDQGDHASARALFEESLNQFKELEDKGGIAWALCCLGYTAFDQGDYPAAQPQLEEGLNLFQELGDRRGVAWALNSLGNVASAEGDYASARALHEESLEIRRELGDRQGTAWSLHSLGNAAHSAGASATARALLAESLNLFRELKDRKGVADSLGGLTAVMLAQAEVSKAVRLWGAVHALRESIGSPLSPLGRENYYQQIAQARLAMGADAFALAWEEGHGLNWEQAVSYALEEACV